MIKALLSSKLKDFIEKFPKQVSKGLVKKTKKQKLIYFASPFTHVDPKIMLHRELMVTHHAAALTEKYGYAMFLPITQSAPMERSNPNLKGDFKSWASIDLFIVKEKADELWVCMLDGWRESVGVTAEIKAAQEVGIPIRYYNPIFCDFIAEEYL